MASPRNWQVSFTAALRSILDEQLKTWWIKHKPMAEHEFLSKAALARQIGVNVNTLWRWELGERRPRGLHWKILADGEAGL
jgi:DNA-binding transcriptional regulator YiaG